MSSTARAFDLPVLLSRVLYILAIVILVLGVFMALSLANAPASIEAAAFAFQSPIFNLVMGLVRPALVSLAIVLFAISLILSVLLFASGMLVARTVTLSRRVERLEAALAQANLLPSPSGL